MAARGLQISMKSRRGQVPYLDALNLLCQLIGYCAIGSVEPHYVASKIFQKCVARSNTSTKRVTIVRVL